ncbi:unnamed protein product [Mytilus edulis]|uniref:IgGFc-binding protein N-terminal domain-containing protein n=1 Tax=Mytilus edulis TaxID=6550 RepID=A0A8S3V8E2_MYTED|nr:unnamed protein product [Mytilus edulis]
MTNITIYYDEITNQSILCNNTEPSYSVDVKSSVSSKLLRIETNFLISVYVIGYLAHGMFGYLALPINILGYEYMVVSYLNYTDINNSQWSYCYIVSVYTNTEIHVLPKPGFEAVYNDGNIVGSEQKIYLNGYETVTLESSTIDLTGMYIKGNKPFQLYCGGYLTTSVFYEQLIPLNAWDYKYVLRDVSGMDDMDCFYRVVSSETDNQIEIENANGDISNYHVSRANYLDLFPVEQEIRSNLTILVVLIKKTRLRKIMAYCEILKLFKGMLVLIHIPTVTVDKVSLTHIPEKFYPGTFDFIGHGHQIFHIMVSIGSDRTVYDSVYSNGSYYHLFS